MPVMTSRQSCTRDSESTIQTFEPSAGSFVRLSEEVAGGIMGGDNDPKGDREFAEVFGDRLKTAHATSRELLLDSCRCWSQLFLRGTVTLNKRIGNGSVISI